MSLKKERSAVRSFSYVVWLRSLVLALIVGAAGGAVFNWFGLPLAWMIGSVTACAAATIMGLPIAAPRSVRPPVAAIIGTVLGSSITAEALMKMPEWIVPMAVLPIFLAVGAVVSITYFRVVARMDKKTAYFAGMPGGMAEMVLLAGENGAKEHVVSIVHALRILIVVLIAPYLLRSLNPDVMLFVSGEAAAAKVFGWDDLAWAALAASAGVALGSALRLPIRYLMGPLCVSAAFHIGGLTDFQLPTFVIAMAQIALGATIGTLFRGFELRALGRIALAATGSVLLLLAITCLFAYAVSMLSHRTFTELLLAYSPGGLTEMSLIAYALNVEVLFVFFMHVVRVVLVAIGAASFLRRA